MKTFTHIAMLFMATILVGAATAQSASESQKYSFGTESQMFIDGTSSLHDWTCDVEKLTGGFQSSANSQSPVYEVTSATLTVSPKEIECGKKVMNGKMRDALESDTDAAIQFVLTEATTVDMSNGPKAASLTGTLRIAGKTVPVVIDATASISSTNQLQFEGSTALLMSDFGIDPPKALLGTLKTGNEITIRFLIKAAQDN